MPSTNDHDESDLSGKGRPTPTRKEREAARKRPLVPGDRKAAKAQSRAAEREQRDREYKAMQTGDERNLPARDRGPERRWVRDYVDARWNPGEWFFPLSLIGILGMLFSSRNQTASMIVAVVLYLGVGYAVLDAYLLGKRVLTALTVKFGESRIPRGIRMYAIQRAFQIRWLRMPKPQVKRGEFPS